MSRPDLNGFFMVNRGLRQEFALLAAAGRAVRSKQHRVLLEDQLQLCVSLLEQHHREQDTWLFPTLIERDPESRPGVETLQQDHEQIDLVVAGVRNSEMPLEERVPALVELHALLNKHIEREERDAVPVILRTIAASEWEHSGKRMMNGIPHGQMPNLFGWLASASEEDELSQALTILPIGARLLFRLVWGPAYQRRLVELYR